MARFSKKKFIGHKMFVVVSSTTFVQNVSHSGKQDQDGTGVPSWSCSKAVYKPVWHIPLLSVQWINSWWWTDELSETCRVSWQNKFVKLLHLVGFITKKFVNARSQEREKNDEYNSQFSHFCECAQNESSKHFVLSTLSIIKRSEENRRFH